MPSTTIGPSQVAPGWAPCQLVGDGLVKATEDRELAPITTFRWTVEGDELRLEMLDHPSVRFEDMIVTRTSRQPFTRVR